MSTRRSKHAIIASCAEDHFEAAVAAMRAHNTSTPDGCGKVPCLAASYIDPKENLQMACRALCTLKCECV